MGGKHLKNKAKIERMGQYRESAIIFLIGTCPNCGYLRGEDTPRETDTLYRCERCGFPIEAVQLQNMVDAFPVELGEVKEMGLHGKIP